jgi:hypothetical protein
MDGGGRPTPEGFSYASNTNPEGGLDARGLQALLLQAFHG